VQNDHQQSPKKGKKSIPSQIKVKAAVISREPEENVSVFLGNPSDASSQ